MRRAYIEDILLLLKVLRRFSFWSWWEKELKNVLLHLAMEFIRQLRLFALFCLSDDIEYIWRCVTKFMLKAFLLLHLVPALPSKFFAIFCAFAILWRHEKMELFEWLGTKQSIVSNSDIGRTLKHTHKCSSILWKLTALSSSSTIADVDRQIFVLFHPWNSDVYEENGRAMNIDEKRWRRRGYINFIWHDIAILIDIPLFYGSYF
jgi:hypothetical protein